MRTTHEQTTAVTAERGLTATVSDCDEPQATQGLQKNNQHVLNTLNSRRKPLSQRPPPASKSLLRGHHWTAHDRLQNPKDVIASQLCPSSVLLQRCQRTLSQPTDETTECQHIS